MEGVREKSGNVNSIKFGTKKAAKAYDVNRCCRKMYCKMCLKRSS